MSHFCDVSGSLLQIVVLFDPSKMPRKRKANAAPQGADATKKAAPQGNATKKKAGGGGGGGGGGGAAAAGDGENNERKKARGKGKATPTTTLVSNKGTAASGMSGPGNSSAIGAKCTVDAAGKRTFAPLNHCS